MFEAYILKKKVHDRSGPLKKFKIENINSRETKRKLYGSIGYHKYLGNTY